jgi:predicted transposase YdaD
MIDGQPYSFYRFEQIRKEQLLISYFSKGAITISETDDMPIHDRKLLLNTLRQAEEERKKKLDELKQSRQYRKPRRR